MRQSKKHSFVEACTSTAIGFVVAVIGTFFVVWALDIESTPVKNIKMTIFFTILSIIRGYFIRRWFDRYHNKKSKNKSDITKPKFEKGDLVITKSSHGTVIDDVRWDDKLNEFHYFYINRFNKMVFTTEENLIKV